MNINIPGNVFGPTTPADNSLVLFDGTTGKLVKALTGYAYNAAYSTMGNSPVIIQSGQGFATINTYTHISGTFPSTLITTTYTPSGASSGGSTGFKVRTSSTGTNSYSTLTGADIYTSIDGAQTYLASVGISGICEVSANATGTGGIIGILACASHAGASASAAGVTCIRIDASDGGTRTTRGTITKFYGLDVGGLGVTSATVGTRAAIHIETMAGSAGTANYAIHSEATQSSLLIGGVAVGAAGNGGAITWFGNTSGSCTVIVASVAGAVAVTLPVATGKLISVSAVTTEVIVSDTSLTVNYNGTTYKLLARA